MTNEDILKKLDTLEVNSNKVWVNNNCIDLLKELKELCNRLDDGSSILSKINTLTGSKGNTYNNLIYRTLISNGYLLDKEEKRNDKLNKILD